MYVSDIEIEERDTKNKTEELDRLHATMKKTFATASNTEYRKIANIDFVSWFLVTKVLLWIKYQSISFIMINLINHLKQFQSI